VPLFDNKQSIHTHSQPSNLPQQVKTSCHQAIGSRSVDTGANSKSTHTATRNYHEVYYRVGSSAYATRCPQEIVELPNSTNTEHCHRSIRLSEFQP